MNEFRRLISYIYEYEGKVKGKNVGFVKLEARNGLCKLNINVKKLYIGSSNMGVYLLSARKEIFLGNLFLRNGCGEFRAVVQVSNIEESGETMDECYGLSIHEKNDHWREYTTIWEDTMAQAAQLALESAASETTESVTSESIQSESKVLESIQSESTTSESLRLESAVPENTSENKSPVLQVRNHTNLPYSEPQKSREAEKDFQKNAEELPISKDTCIPEEVPLPAGAEIKAENKSVLETVRDSLDTETNHGQSEGITEPSNEESEETQKEIREKIQETEHEIPYNEHRQKTAASSMVQPITRSRMPFSPLTRRTQGGPITAPRQAAAGMPPHTPAASRGQILQTKTTAYPQQTQKNTAPVRPISPTIRSEESLRENQPNTQEKTSVIRQENEEPILVGDPEALAKLEEEEQTAPIPLWDFLVNTYPKIQAFDSQYGCQVLVIKPQDIGLLPREIWIYGNNSFLLHGYYNYRYLILARLENPNGIPRYLLGVPGHYFSNEKYMASMFGFPHFVLSKHQQPQDGRFGYWYTDIRLGNGSVPPVVAAHYSLPGNISQ